MRELRPDGQPLVMLGAAGSQVYWQREVAGAAAGSGQWF